MAHLTTVQRSQGVLQDNNPDGLLEKIWRQQKDVQGTF
jgi:hypothetical protein